MIANIVYKGQSGMDGTDREGSTHSSGPKDRPVAVAKPTETGIVYQI